MNAKPLNATGWAMLAFTVAAGAAGTYRIVAHTIADHHVESHPSVALGWIADHPQALYRLAEQQIAAGDHAGALKTAKRLQQAAPLDGRAFRLQAQVYAAEGKTTQAKALFEHAVALSPRDLPARAWLIQHHLVTGAYPAALDQADRILRYQPRQAAVLLPLMAQLAQDPAFAAHLVPTLATRPPWREALLREAQSGRHPLSARRILDGLRESGGLTREEHERWVADLMRQGEWGEAYARWSSTLPAGESLPLVYNGDFEKPPSGQGFDWRVRPIPGVSVSFEPTNGTEGLAAHVVFRRRPVAEAGLEQALLLPPGAQTVAMRIRTEGLRTDRGFEWQLQCGNGRVLGSSARLQGTQSWQTVTITAQIPPECPGQWLRLRNPAPTGTAQFAEGELWVDDVALTSAIASSTSP